MATLTKEQLKNELISHGIQPPVQSARKEEFVKLYEQHVAPIVSQKGDFSSDEETEVVIEEKVIDLYPFLKMNLLSFELQVEVSNNSLVFNGLDITTISDDDLYSQLQSFGIPVGPIVGKQNKYSFNLKTTINLFAISRHNKISVSKEISCTFAEWNSNSCS